MSARARRPRPRRLALRPARRRAVVLRASLPTRRSRRRGPGPRAAARRPPAASGAGAASSAAGGGGRGRRRKPTFDALLVAALNRVGAAGHAGRARPLCAPRFPRVARLAVGIAHGRGAARRPCTCRGSCDQRPLARRRSRRRRGQRRRDVASWSSDGCGARWRSGRRRRWPTFGTSCPPRRSAGQPRALPPHARCGQRVRRAAAVLAHYLARGADLTAFSAAHDVNDRLGSRAFCPLIADGYFHPSAAGHAVADALGAALRQLVAGPRRRGSAAIHGVRAASAAPCGGRRLRAVGRRLGAAGRRLGAPTAHLAGCRGRRPTTRWRRAPRAAVVAAAAALRRATRGGSTASGRGSCRRARRTRRSRSRCRRWRRLLARSPYAMVSPGARLRHTLDGAPRLRARAARRSNARGATWRTGTCRRQRRLAAAAPGGGCARERVARAPASAAGSSSRCRRGRRRSGGCSR